MSDGGTISLTETAVKPTTKAHSIRSIATTLTNAFSAGNAYRPAESGRWVRVTSRHGSLVIKVLVTTRVHGKQVYLPLFSREGPINILTGSQADAATNTPAFKETAVKIRLLPEQGTNPLKPLNFRYSGKATPQTEVEVERKDYRMPGTDALVQIQTQK